MGFFETLSITTVTSINMNNMFIFLAKGCIGHYMRNLRSPKFATEPDNSTLIINLLNLLKDSASSTKSLITDFESVHGIEFLVEFCMK
jgi:hypothetical protein